MRLLLVLAVALIKCRFSFVNNLKVRIHQKQPIENQNNIYQLYASEFLDELQLKPWGSFTNTSVKLQAKPSFMVVTGKSGTGKSVLIGAFEYLIKQGRESKGNGKKESRDIFTTSGDDIAIISIMKNRQLLQRSFSITSKKSTCEIDGKRVPVKQFTKQLPIRFWYKDSLKYLDSGSDGVITYIHDLASIDELFLFDLATSHRDWQANRVLISQHEEFENLNEVKKMELSMLRHFVSEVDLVRDRILNILHDISESIEFLLSEDGRDTVESNEESSEDDNRSDLTVAKVDPKLNLKSLHTYLGIVLSDNKPSHHGGLWRAMIQCFNVMTPLADASAPLFSVKSTASDSIAGQRGASSHVAFGNKISSSSIGGALNRGLNLGVSTPAISNNNIKLGSGKLPLTGAESELEKYLTAIEHFNATCDVIGVMSGLAAVAQLELIRASLECALSELIKSKEIIASLRSEWTQFHRNLEELSILRQDWESVARKHSCASIDLEKKYEEWGHKLSLSDSIHVTLPQLRQEEKKLRNNYCQLAAQLTLHRLKAASRLSDFVNNVLPSLEMADKRISFKHSFTSGKMSAATDLQSDSLEISAESLSKQLSLLADTTSCSEYGWDDFELQIHSTRTVSSNSLQRSVLAVDTLSSGEKSRLALALETGYLQDLGDAKEEKGFISSMKQSTDSNNNVANAKANGHMQTEGQIEVDNESDGSDDPVLVVFDELDAHVGGEAALAVARLLKQQGKHRQIIVVTHSPIVAAAADRHFVVSKVSDNKSSNAMSNCSPDSSMANDMYSSSSSIVTEVDGVGREEELARMATGSGTNQKGRELARELLSLYSDASINSISISLTYSNLTDRLSI